MPVSPMVFLGPPFSGTNLFASSLASTGPEFHDNILQANSQCLAAVGMSRHAVDPMPTAWSSMPLVDDAISRLRNEIQIHSKLSTPWGLNDPAVSLLLPIYEQIFDAEGTDPFYLICVPKPTPKNHPDSAAPVQMHSIGSWLFYTLSALHAAGGNHRWVLPMENFQEGSMKDLMELLSRKDVPREPETGEDREDFKNLPPLVPQTYALCIKAASNHAAFQAGEFDQEISALYEEFTRLTRMIRPPLPPDAPMMFFWMEGSQTKQADKMFSPAGTWQTISIEIPAPPNSPLQVAPYHMPCEMWIRKAIWRVGGTEIPAQLTPGPNGRLEMVEGITRLTIFGPAALLLVTPSTPGSLTLEMEFFMQASEAVLENILATLSEKLKELTAVT